MLEPFHATRSKALEVFEAQLRESAKAQAADPEWSQECFAGYCTFEVEYEDGDPVGYRVLMGRWNGTWMDLEGITDPDAIVAEVRTYSDGCWDEDIENERLKRSVAGD